MARTYTTVGWEDGTVLQPAKVTVQGTEYNVENEVVTGRTPINAQNLRKMDNEIKRIVEEDIPSVYDEKLLTISDTAPSECIEGDKYYNTTDNKIYTAVATDTWSQDGDTPIEGKLYIVFNEQSTYAYNGTTLVSVGGGSGSSDIVIIGDESETTEDTKLLVDTSGTTDTLKYKDNNTFTELQIKALDSMPVGTVVEFNGQESDIPSGWEETTDTNSYSTSEIKTDKTWIDGKPIYRKVLNITSQSQNHNINNLDTITYFKALVHIDSLYGKCDVSNDISVQTSVIWLVNRALENVSNTISLVLEYTKTTD